jgi:hypothetical protein
MRISALLLVALMGLFSLRFSTAAGDSAGCGQGDDDTAAGRSGGMGKHVFRLAPGAQIRSTDNRIMLPVMIGSEQVVRYLLDANGDLSRVWIFRRKRSICRHPNSKTAGNSPPDEPQDLHKDLWLPDERVRLGQDGRRTR